MTTSPSFFIPDTSAIFEYSPCVNCGAAGWQSAFSRKQDGFDQTFHQASQGSVDVAFNITTTSLEIVQGSIGPACAVKYSINGSDFAAGCGDASGLGRLPLGRHAVLLRTINGSEEFQFFGIQGTVALPAGRVANRTIDDTFSSFTYNPAGAWSQVDSLGHVGDLANSSAVANLGDMSNLFNSSMGVTTAVGASAELKFTAGAIYIFGVSGPEGGEATVVLDGDEQARLSMMNPWNTYSSLLYMTSGLDTAREHTLSFTNTVAGKQLVIDYALITIPEPARKRSLSLPLLIGSISGSAIVVIIAIIILYFYCIKRRHSSNRSEAEYAFAEGIGTGYDDRSKRSSIDWWRRQTSLHSPSIVGAPNAPSAASEFGDGPMGRVYAQPMEMGERYPIAKLYQSQTTAHPQAGAGVSVSQFNSRPVEQEPDYIPYRPPSGWTATPRTLFPSSPDYSPARSGATPPTIGHSQVSQSPRTPRQDVPLTPLISGLDPVVPWLQENSTTNTASPAQAHDVYDINRMASPVSLGRSAATGRDRDDNRWTATQSTTQPTDGPPSPRSFSEDFKLVDVRHARRSIARLWPSRDAVPSDYRTSTLELTPLSFTRRARAPDVYGLSPNSSNPRTGGLTNTSLTESSLALPFSPQPPLTTATLPPSAYPHPNQMNPSRAQRNPHEPTSFPPQALTRSPTKANSIASRSLRRGVSIKSVKTVKSFFSTLLRADTSQSPSTSHSQNHPLPTPRIARPDSDIFPSTADGSRLETPHTTAREADSRAGVYSGTKVRARGGEIELEISPGSSSNMFIELSPESPMSARPGSAWPTPPISRGVL